MRTPNRRHDLLTLLVTVLVLSALAGCAKVADPLPPVTTRPDAPKDVRSIQTAQQITLTFPAPPADIRSVLVYKQCGPQVSWDDSEPVARLEATGLQAAGAGLVSHSGLGAEPGCQYAIRFENERERVSPVSNIVATSAVAAPLPPTSLRSEVREDRVVVTWDPPSQDVTGAPAAVVGYLVNGTTLVTAPSFEDKTFEFGKPRIYYVQAVSRVDNPLTLSAKSQDLAVTPADVFGPAAPKTVSGLLVDGKVQLLWEASEAPDFKAYRIYRGSDKNQMARLAEVATPSFTDETPLPDPVVYYGISAVDQLGNEGPRSEPAKVERPQP